MAISVVGYSQSLSYLDYLPTQFEGDTVTELVYARSLEGNLLNTPVWQKAKVYLPPNYDRLSRNQYPVHYFLHGIGGDHDFIYRERQCFEKMNEFVTGLKIKPAILVTPDSRNTDLDMGTWYSNSYVTGNWQDYISCDLTHHIDSVFKVNPDRKARGLSGPSMGGYGALMMGIMHPSVFATIGSLSAGPVNFEIFCSNYLKPYLIKAAQLKEYGKATDWQTQMCFTMAAAFAPDSTQSSLGRIPYNEDGERIDSIWQQWLEHDPTTLLSYYKDSLRSLSSFLMYIGNTDEFFLEGNQAFHQALLDNNISHTYKVFNGGHSIRPIYDEVFLFSDNLYNAIPTLKKQSEYFLERDDTLFVESDADGTIFIIKYESTIDFETIINGHVASAKALADSMIQIPVSDFDFAKYQVFAMNPDSAFSNIPVEFCLVPTTSPPELFIEKDTVMLSESVLISSDRNGTLCFIESSAGTETFQSADEIVNYTGLVHFESIGGDSDYHYDANILGHGSYHVYCYDTYGFLSGPEVLTIIDNTSVQSHGTRNIIDLYPNPFHRELNIATTKTDVDMIIYSVSGKKILDFSNVRSNHSLDLSNLREGVYYITIRSEDFVATKKIIKI
jgi:enterochelin esterase-like enzyme